MATVHGTKVDSGDPDVVVYEWVLASGDVGLPAYVGKNTDICVQVMVISGATVTWQGSLDTSGTVWGTVHKVDGTDLTQTLVGTIAQVLEGPLVMRPSSSGGSTTVRLKATN